jgi:uncharacterized membrane protein
MSREAVALALTFVLACASATFFLLLRCEGRGRAFGPRSRRWAIIVIILTSLFSAGGAAGLAVLGRYVPAVIMSLGVAMPGSLCLGRIRDGIPERRSVYGAAWTLWLGFLLARMTEGMAEDKLEWCERRVDTSWHPDELILAAHYYHDYLNERLSPENRKRYRIRTLLQDVETRLDIVMIIEAHAPRSKIVAAINASRLGKEARYQRNLDDLGRLGGRLQHDARRALERMLAAAYVTGLYRLDCYSTPVRELAPEPAERAGAPRWHP